MPDACTDIVERSSHSNLHAEAWRITFAWKSASLRRTSYSNRPVCSAPLSRFGRSIFRFCFGSLIRFVVDCGSPVIRDYESGWWWPTGSRTRTVVPEVDDSMLISPPKCLILSRIPRVPNPAPCFWMVARRSGEMPRPKS